MTADTVGLRAAQTFSKLNDRLTLDEPNVKVMIADAQRPFREGVRAHLGFGFRVVGEAASVSELEQLAATTTADLVLVDQTLPGGGLAAALEVAPSGAAIVVFAEQARDEQVIEALRLGVSGYLLKDIAGNQLGATLRGVVAGEPALDRSLVGALFDEIARREGSEQLVLLGGGHVFLTPREKEVALRLRGGLSTKAIAAELGISVVTVRRHVSELMRKLHVETRAAAITVLGG
jgi:two-component system nitrate/nitrite response regulator NarL